MQRLLAMGICVPMLMSCADQARRPDPSPTGIEVSTTSSDQPTTTSTVEPNDVTTATARERFHVLVFDKTAGFAHESIPAGVEAIDAMGGEHGFTVTATDDAAIFTSPDLEDFSVVVFLNTTGDILDEDQQLAMERFIEAGNGFVGIHSASDTEYDWPWYGQLVGAYFDNHPPPQPATVRVVQPSHAAMGGLPPSFERFDEWYNFRQPPGPGVEVLATLDETTYEGGTMGEPHPIIWAHDFDGGRAVYTGFGHTAETFSEPLVRAHLANAIRWAQDESDT